MQSMHNIYKSFSQKASSFLLCSRQTYFELLLRICLGASLIILTSFEFLIGIAGVLFTYKRTRFLGNELTPSAT
jgi:hypothetical protein